jgi:hypothetical protein
MRSFKTLPVLVATMLVVAFVKEQWTAVAMVAALSATLFYIKWDYCEIFFFVVVFFEAPLSEALSVYKASWTYADPRILGVPYWLLFAWANAAIYLTRLLEAIREFAAHK